MRPVALLPAEMETMDILTYDPHFFYGVEADPPCSLRIGMDKRQVFAMKSGSLYTKGNAYSIAESNLIWIFIHSFVIILLKWLAIRVR